MAYTDWLTALLIAGALGRMGALPKTVTLEAATPYLQQRVPLRIGIAQSAQTIKVVPTGRATVTLEGDVPATLALASGQPLFARPAHGLAVIEAAPAQILCRRAVISSARPLRVSSWGVLSRSGVYPARLEIAVDASGALTGISIVPLEQYLQGVVATEMPVSFPMQALKAQAIIARTYALFNLGQHADEGFDLCAEVHCQLYRGVANEPRARAAVQGTAGQVVAYRGCLADAVYHSTCGGMVDDSYRVWSGYLLPYLRARPDRRGHANPPDVIADEAQAERFIARPRSDYCQRSPRHRWNRSYTTQEAQRLVEANLPLVAVCDQPPGRVLDMSTEGRSAGGRVQTLRIITDTGTYEVKRNDIRWLFGAGKPGPTGLPSTLFRLHVERNPDGSPARFVFEGAGWGHGLGLCQWGAQGRARAGASARQILEAYYPGAAVVALPGENTAGRGNK